MNAERSDQNGSDWERFVTGKPGAALLGPPRSGKTSALVERAKRLSTPVLVATADAGLALPGAVRVCSFTGWIASTYLRLGGGTRRVIDLEDLRRVFREVNSSTLPGDLRPWFDGYCAGKRIRSLDAASGYRNICHRHGLGVAGSSAAAILQDATQRTDLAMAAAGMTTIWDTAGDLVERLRNRRTSVNLLMDGLTELLIDDAQLLTPYEFRLIDEIVKGGGAISCTVGRYQCFNMRDGGIGLSVLPRLRTAGFRTLTLTNAPGITVDQANLMMTSAGTWRDPPFKGTSKKLFSLRYVEHEDEEAAVEKLAASLCAEDQAIFDGSLAVIVPLPHYAERLTSLLGAMDVPVTLAGRRAMQTAPSFLIANSIVHAIRNPTDLNAMRQIATLWLDSLDQFEAIALHALSNRCTLREAAADMNEFDAVASMEDWLVELAGKAPMDVATAIRAAPHWVADDVLERGLTYWTDLVERKRCAASWQAPRWPEILTAGGDTVYVCEPAPGRVSVLPLQDTVGASWDIVEFVGFSDALLPAECPPSERALELHSWMQLISRARTSLRLHHVEKLGLGLSGEQVSLKPSMFAAAAGLTTGDSLRQGNPRFVARPTLKG